MEATRTKTYCDVKEGFEAPEKGFTRALKNEEATITQVETEDQHLRQQIAELKKRDDMKGQQMSFLAQKDQEKDKKLQQLAQQIQAIKRELDEKDEILGAQFIDAADPNRVDETILAKVEEKTETQFEKFKMEMEEKHTAKINTINQSTQTWRRLSLNKRRERVLPRTGICQEIWWVAFAVTYQN